MPPDQANAVQSRSQLPHPRAHPLLGPGAAKVNGQGIRLVLDRHSALIPKGLLEQGPPLHNPGMDVPGSPEGFHPVIANETFQPEAANPPGEVGQSPARDDHARIEGGNLAEELAGGGAQGRALRIGDDGREGSIEVEGHQCVGPGEGVEERLLP